MQLRVQWLLAKDNSFSRLDALIDWERFRSLLEVVWNKPAKDPGEPRRNDPLKMFKALLVQHFYNLSAEQTEYQINDRLSFQQFIGWTLADKIPDANTRWDFREALIEVGAFEKLSQSMKGFYLRSIRKRRNEAAIGFINRIYSCD